MAETGKYQISNYQAAAQLGALAGQIQSLLIIEPKPSPREFAKILYALEVLTEMATDLSNGIKEVMSSEQ